MKMMINNFVWKLKLLIANLTVFLTKAGEEVLVGGQAVFEGVMMRSPGSYSIAVRKPDRSIVVKKDYLKRASQRNKVWRYPVIRGVMTLGQAFVLGLRALKFSTDQVLIGRVPQSEKSGRSQAEGKTEISPWMMAFNVGFAILFFIVFFKLFPLLIASQLKEYFALLDNRFLFSVADGSVRLFIFLAYIFSISKIKDIKRIFEYHGAEHKVVFNYESREKLSIQNARKYPTLHPRCGTSFLMVVMLTSTFVYALIPFNSFSLKLLSRVVLIPLIAGLSYEIIRFAAARENSVLNLITLPGLWLQKVTTKEPSDDQLEIAIKALDEAIILENAQGKLAVI